jgi:hypothetical protein
MRVAFEVMASIRGDTGSCSLRHAASPSVGRSVADLAQASLSTGSRSHLLPGALERQRGPGQSLDRFPVSPSPVGSRSQGADTRIPAE